SGSPRSAPMNRYQMPWQVFPRLADTSAPRKLKPEGVLRKAEKSSLLCGWSFSSRSTSSGGLDAVLDERERLRQDSSCVSAQNTRPKPAAHILTVGHYTVYGERLLVSSIRDKKSNADSAANLSSSTKPRL